MKFDNEALNWMKLYFHPTTGVQFDTHVIVNPGNTCEWIVLFKKDAGTSFFLVDEQEQVDTFADLNQLVDELRLLGIKSVELSC